MGMATDAGFAGEAGSSAGRTEVEVAGPEAGHAADGVAGPEAGHSATAAAAASEAELRRELAAVIRGSVDEIAETLESEYVKEYPRSRSNVMDARLIHEWTLGSIENFAVCAESGDVARLSFVDSYGDALEDPGDFDLTCFASNLSAILFQARHIAPIVYRCAFPNMARGRELVGLFERCMQQALEANCRDFTLLMGAPGALVRRWDLSSALRMGSIAPDSPASRHMPQHRFRRIMRKDEEAEPTQPPAGRLTGRERDILELICDGKTNGEIAAALGISQNTVKNHVTHLFDKYNVNSRTQLVLAVKRDGA